MALNESLWIDQYKPDIEDLLQNDARDFFSKAADSPLNLLVYGPKGVGKTAGVEALGRESHDNPENDMVFINAADFFSMTKKDLESDDRFGQFITAKKRRNTSKAGLMNYVLKELAAYEPVSGMHKTIVIDNAESMREDFQQALRRIMERYHESTQFAIVTRSPSSIIPPIQSRCAVVPMHSPTSEEVATVLQDIAEQEGIEYTIDGIEFVAGYSDGDLRRAITALQTVAERGDDVTDQTAFEYLSGIGIQDRVDEALDAAAASEMSDARAALDELLIDEGVDPQTVLRELTVRGQDRFGAETAMAVAEIGSDVDTKLVSGDSDRVHLMHFLTQFRAVTDSRSQNTGSFTEVI